MTARLVDLTERVGMWQQAFDAVRREYTPQAMRDTLAAMDTVQGIEQLQSYMSLARGVMANDRTAAIVAAMLVTNGIRPMPLGDDR